MVLNKVHDEIVISNEQTLGIQIQHWHVYGEITAQQYFEKRQILLEYINSGRCDVLVVHAQKATALKGTLSIVMKSVLSSQKTVPTVVIGMRPVIRVLFNVVIRVIPKLTELIWILEEEKELDSTLAKLFNL